MVSGDVRVAQWLLIVGPVVGMVPVANPSLIRIWSLPRAEFARAVSAHPVAWAWLNAGFAWATVVTAAGLVALGAAAAGATGSATGVLVAATAYVMGGSLWCAVLAIRSRTEVVVGAARYESGRGPSLLDAAVSGLFAAFVLITSAALAVLGTSLLVSGIVPSGVAIGVLAVGVGSAVWQLRTGDLIPAVLYLPTLLVGLTLQVPLP